jgi:hypothetical protein
VAFRAHGGRELNADLLEAFDFDDFNGTPAF